jgi:alpha-methylacyl-CoA racemase
MKEKLAAVIKQKTQAQWCEIMEGTDVCFAPVLSFMDAPAHPANVARNTYIEVDGITQPAPAPRFSRTPSQVRHGGRDSGQDTDAVLAAMGFGEREIADLKQAGAIA